MTFRALLTIGGAALAFGPSPASAGTLRPDGLVDVDGRAFYPVGLLDVGWRDYDDWNERIRRSGANCVWDFEVAYEGVSVGCSALLDSARAAGYRLLIGSSDTINWDDPSTPFFEVDVPIYDRIRLASLVRCARDEPSRILGYTNRDEPVWTSALGRLSVGRPARSQSSATSGCSSRRSRTADPALAVERASSQWPRLMMPSSAALSVK